MSTPNPSPSPDKIQQAEKGIADARQAITNLTGLINNGTTDKPTLNAGLQAVSTAIASVPTHKPS